MALKAWIGYVSYIYSNNCFPIVLKVASMTRSLFHKLFFDDSDEDEIIEELVIETSQPKQRRSIWSNHLVGHERLFLDYFAPTPIYPPALFCRRFRMKCSLFLCIQSKVESHNSYFVQKRNSATNLVYLRYKK